MCFFTVMNSIYRTLTLGIILAVSWYAHGTSRELVFSNVLWRHGDRAYIYSYPTDPYKYKNIWKNGLGELTNTGIKEQYELGKYLRSRYGGLVSENYHYEHIYVKSTDVDRTLMSAESNMAGFYPPTKQASWNGSNTSWQPIPIHTVPAEMDNLLHYPIGDCPKYDAIMKTIRKSSWYIEHERNNSVFYNIITNYTGFMTTLNLSNIWRIADNLHCLSANHYPLPEWVTPDIYSHLQILNGLDMGIGFTDVDYKHREMISKMQGGVLLKEIVRNMTDFIEGRSNYSLVAYSVHDTTLVALLVAIGNYDWIQPVYASTMMFELYKDKEKYFVEIYYRNSRSAEPRILNFDDCGTTCPFEIFLKKATRLIPDDRKKICEHYDDNPTGQLAWLMALSLLVSALIVLLLWFIFKKSKSNNYQKINSAEEELPI